MSTTPTARIRTSRVVDVIGMIVVVTSLVLGLVPGLGVGPASAGTVNVSLDQCANDQNNDDVQAPCAWVNGNLNKNNSIYAEGDSVGFRARLTGLTVGDYYEVPVNYDILNSGYIAYDQITSWEHSEIGDPLAGTGVTGPEDTFTVGTDPYTQFHLGGAPTGVSNFDVSIWGGEWDTSNGAFEYVGATPPLPTGANDSVTTDVVFRFQATGESVVIAWGGHIALRQDWNSKGYDTAPQSTSGSPYHMRNGDKLGVKSNAGDPYTYSSLGNQDRSLKADAVILPGGIEIIKTNTDDPALPLTGFTYSITGPDGFSEACTTPNCTFTEVPIGTYTVTETGVSGDYVLDPTPQVLEVLEGEVTTFTFRNERIDYVIDVTPDTDTNSATNAHEFTVTLAEDVNGNGQYDQGTDTPLDGESVSLAWEAVSGATFTGAITKIGTTVLNPALTSTSCTTDASGQCLVTVSSDSAGGGALSATWTGMDYQHTTTADPVTNATMGEPYDSITDSGSKSWIGYRVTIGDDGLNLIRDDHDFTVTVYEVDEAGNESLASSNTTVKVKWQGPTGSTLNDVVQTTDSCVTAGGTCTVTVGSSNPGSGTLHVTEVSGQPVTGEDLTVTFADDEMAADKTWVEFRALISGNSTNLVDEPHTFDVNVEYRVTTGDNWQQIPDESDVDIRTSTLAPGQSSSDTCDDTTAESPGTYLDDRVCTVTVDADAAGSVTVTVFGINSAVITNDGITEDFKVEFGTGKPGVGTFTSADYSSTKSWGSYSLALTPGQATNLLTPAGGGQDHTITATLSSEGSAPVAGQEIDIWVSGGDAGAITSVENGSLGGDGVTWTCTTDADGECDIVVTSSSPGTIKIDADFRSDYFDSGEIHVEADEATKDWTEFQVTVSPDAENLLSTNGTHTFTVYVEQFNPDQPVEDAVLSIGVEQEDETKEVPTFDDSDCTDGINPGGLCVVHVTTTEVQRVTLTATYGAVVESAHLEDDQTADFEDEGTKTWIDYRVDVTPETDTNLVNTDHTFTVVITRITPDGEEPVDDGTVPMVAYGGGAEDIDLEAGTCDNGTVSGTCTVVVSTAGTGTQTLIVTYEGTASGEVGVEDDHSDTFRGTAAKTWVDYRVTLDDDAVNTVGDEHTFTAFLEVDNGDGEGWVPAVDETLQFTLDGIGSVTGGDVDETLACITNDDDPGTTDVDEAGTCTIAINSGEAGTSTVGVTYTVPQGTLGVTAEEGVSRDDEAVKQWVDIELVKTAVTGDGFTDGDLIADPGGFPFLSFTSSDQGPKTAVFEYLITNPSNVTLEDVALVDDRLGTIDLTEFPDCQTLDPGESCTARGSEQFDYFDATASLASLITNVGTVTATGGGEEVSDSDDATITLVAVQSSILIDLVKDVVAGEGDVKDVDGLPIVNWSEEEYEDGVTKTVRYRFTVTNISNAPIIDVELLDPMVSDEPIIAKADGVTLQPGESTVVEVDHQLTVDQAFPDGPVASKIDNVATVSGANETRDSFSEASDDASVFSEIVFAEVFEKEEPLPATGFGAGGLVPVSMLLIMVGAAVLWLDRRRVTGR